LSIWEDNLKYLAQFIEASVVCSRFGKNGFISKKWRGETGESEFLKASAFKADSSACTPIGVEHTWGNGTHINRYTLSTKLQNGSKCQEKSSASLPQKC